MEQAIWLYAGIIAALFVIGIVASIALTGQEQMKEVQVTNALSRIQQRASMLCSSESGTMVSEKINIPSGAVLTAGTSDSPKKVCILFKGVNKCESIECNLFYDDGTNSDLNLDTDFHKRLYQMHEFTCFFERTGAGVVFECNG